MSFKNEIKQIYQSKQTNKYPPNINETASAIVSMGKDGLRRAAASTNINMYKKTSFFGKESLFYPVTTLYIKNSLEKFNSRTKGHVFEKKYDGELYGYELYDVSDLNQLVKLITQECKKDDIIVSTKNNKLDNYYVLMFEVNL